MYVNIYIYISLSLYIYIHINIDIHTYNTMYYDIIDYNMIHTPRGRGPALRFLAQL